ncbi:MAG: trypsin-like peptidase domain-containing protein [Parcubacteria group bacterium]|nr:trypsin-like peptidase domain-containing protein [Parcubacteria group bacterium]
MIKRIFLIICIFVLGAAGGIWAQAFLLPYLASTPAFQDLKFIQEWNARTVLVQPVSRISVDEPAALEKTVEKSSKTVVLVQSSALRKGSGLVVTSDGLILTRASLVPSGFGVSVLLDQGQEKIPAQVLKRDAANNLALLKVDKNNLSTAGFVNEGELRPGMKLVLLARNDTGTVVNEGIVRSVTGDLIQSTMTETASSTGATVFTVEGRVAGIAAIAPSGSVTVIPASFLRSFLGL